MDSRMGMSSRRFIGVCWLGGLFKGWFLFRDWRREDKSLLEKICECGYGIKKVNNDKYLQLSNEN